MRATNAGRDSSSGQMQLEMPGMDPVPPKSKPKHQTARIVSRAEVACKSALKKSVQGHASLLADSIGISMC